MRQMGTMGADPGAVLERRLAQREAERVKLRAALRPLDLEALNRLRHALAEELQRGGQP